MRLQRGFSYVVVMFLVAAVSIVSVRAMENSLTAERREKERELLLVGQAYRDAIRTYYEQSPGTLKRFPSKADSMSGDPIDLLLLDVRHNRPPRHLRKRFRDPVTGGSDWGMVYSGDDLVGVHSLSTREPLKKDGFPSELSGFKGAKTYAAWRFVFEPPKTETPVGPAPVVVVAP